jgi:lipopolysaccharide export system permease protein
MLKKLDYYIIKKFLGTFFYAILLITMIAIVIDFSEKVDKLFAPGITMKQVLFDYYLHFIPWINGLLWPLFALLSVIFFTSRLAKNNEIISILSSGVSYGRFLRPYLVASTLLASFLWIGNNFVIPKSIKLKNEFEEVQMNRSKTKTLGYNTHFFLSPDEKVYLRHYRSKDTTGSTFRYEKFKDNKLIYILKANRMTLKEAPNLWTLHDYEKRSFNGMKENFVSGKGQQLDTILSLEPKDFLRNSRLIQNTTTTDLLEYIDIEQQRGLDTAQAMKIEVHRRSADPVTIIILTLLGVAIASRKVRGGLGFHIASGVIIGAAFVLVSRFSMTISNNLSIHPAFGMWLPNIIFAIVALILVSRAQK